MTVIQIKLGYASKECASVHYAKVQIAPQNIYLCQICRHTSFNCFGADDSIVWQNVHANGTQIERRNSGQIKHSNTNTIIQSEASIIARIHEFIIESLRRAIRECVGICFELQLQPMGKCGCDGFMQMPVAPAKSLEDAFAETGASARPSATRKTFEQLCEALAR